MLAVARSRSCAFRVRADNELYDSLQGLSDREAPQEESMKVVAAQLLSSAR